MKNASFQNRFCGLVTALLMAAFLAGLTGCGKSGTAGDRMIADRNKSNIQRVANLYRLYQAKHGWAGPADEKTFKDFIGKTPAKTLSRMGVDPDDVDSMFVSERDSERLVILWGVQGNERASGADAPAVAFEKTGVDGKRMVSFLGADPREVDDAEYNQLMKK